MSLRLPGEMFHTAVEKAPLPEVINTLRDTMILIQPTAGTNHSKRSVFIPQKLNLVSHVFIRVDAVQPPLRPRYEGPYAVLERREKDYKIQLNNRTSWVSIDRLKSAFILREDPTAEHNYASLSSVSENYKKRVRFLLAEGE